MENHDPGVGGRTPTSSGITDPVAEYRRLLAILASRARRLGSRDPEGAAQEALKRSLENPHSRPAMEYYFSEEPLEASSQWHLDRLLAWLHAVLTNVVREETSRAGYRREIGSAGGGLNQPDSRVDPLSVLLRKELGAIVDDCFGHLEDDHRTVLRMRAEGLKYGEIATRLGINENTVATWIGRGTVAMGKMIRRRWRGDHA